MRSTDPVARSISGFANGMPTARLSGLADAAEPAIQYSPTKPGKLNEDPNHGVESDTPIDPTRRPDLDPQPAPPPGGVPDQIPPDAIPTRPEQR